MGRTRQHQALRYTFNLHIIMKTTKWSAAENEATVTAYRKMLDLENAGTKYSKAAFRRELIGDVKAGKPGVLSTRTEGSVEMKFMNISACYRALGRLHIKGYKPLPNYQRELMAEVCKQLGVVAPAANAEKAA
jgi:hypothetical protein